MKDKQFRAWFSDVGFTVRVLIICEALLEWAPTWSAVPDSHFIQAIREVEETAQLEMERYEEVGASLHYFESVMDQPDHDPSNVGEPPLSG